MWEPIIDGRDDVWTAILAIAESLAEVTYPAGDLAIFWTYLATVRDDDATIAARAERASARFLAELERGYTGPALFDGLAGGGWAAAHIATEVEPLLEVIDRKLLPELEAWTGTYDLISGLVGLGVYFLEHESPAAARGRELVVAALAARCERDADGATWLTPAALLPPTHLVRWPDGYYNCGVAHGVPGVIGVLARIATRDDAPPGTAALRDDAIRWLAAHRRDGHVPSTFLGAQRDPARVAWCYGEPGIAAALQAPDPGWLALPFEATGVTEPGLCHGASGLMHLANRMYQATRDARYRDAARHWLERTLAYGTTGLPPPGDVRRDCLLTGTSGVALALLAAVSDLEPSWDRLLLCDLPVA